MALISGAESWRLCKILGLDPDAIASTELVITLDNVIAWRIELANGERFDLPFNPKPTRPMMLKPPATPLPNDRFIIRHDGESWSIIDLQFAKCLSGFQREDTVRAFVTRFNANRPCETCERAGRKLTQCLSHVPWQPWTMLRKTNYDDFVDIFLDHLAAARESAPNATTTDADTPTTKDGTHWQDWK